MIEGIAVVVACLAAIASIFIAFMADGRAKRAEAAAEESNNLAKRANDIAADALTKAAESNQIAKDANELSANANAVIERQASQAVEQHLVEWTIDKHKHGSPVIVLRNLGRDTAYGVSVVIQSRNVHETSDGYDPIPKGGEASIPLPKAVQDKFGEKRLLSMIGDSRTYAAAKQMLTAEVHWLSELGNTHQQTIKVVVI